MVVEHAEALVRRDRRGCVERAAALRIDVDVAGGAMRPRPVDAAVGVADEDQLADVVLVRTTPRRLDARHVHAGWEAALRPTDQVDLRDTEPALDDADRIGDELGLV